MRQTGFFIMSDKLNKSGIASPSTPSSGTDYAAVQNPYNERTYKETGWDRFVSSLGFRSAYDVAEAERLANYNLWESQHAEQQRQEMYNSAQEVKQREEDAGLNPALSGNTIANAGASDALSNAPNAPVRPEPTPVMETFAKVAEFAQGTVGLGLQLAEGIAHVRGLSLENSSKDISNLKGIFSLGEEEVKKLLSTFPTSDKEVGNDFDTLVNSVVTASSDRIPKRYRRQYKNYVGMLLNSNYGKGMRASVINESAGAVAEASGNQEVLSNFKFDNSDGSLAPLSKFTRSIAELQSDIAKDVFGKFAKLKFDRDTHQYQYEMTSFQFQLAQKEMMDKIMATMRNLVDSLSEGTKSKNFIEKSVSTGLLGAASYMMMGLFPDIKISDSPASKRNSDRYDFNNPAPPSVGSWDSTTSW